MQGLIGVLLLLALPSGSGLSAQVNPFFSSPASGDSESDNGTDEQDTDHHEAQQTDGDPEPGRRTVASARTPGPIMRRVSRVQRTLQHNIAEPLQRITDGEGLRALLPLLTLSFAYGFLHALGPGHRKTVLVGYFVGTKKGADVAAWAGVLLALVHAGSAVVLVGGLSWIAVRSLTLSINHAERILMPVSFGIIVLLGIWMIVAGLLDLRRKSASAEREVRSLGGLILSALVPCPAAASIMVLSIAYRSVWVGMVSVAAMSLGMGVLLSSTGIAAVVFRTGLTRVLSSGKAGAVLEVVLHLFGGLLVMVFGVVMFIGSI